MHVRIHSNTEFRKEYSFINWTEQYFSFLRSDINNTIIIDTIISFISSEIHITIRPVCYFWNTKSIPSRPISITSICFPIFIESGLLGKVYSLQTFKSNDVHLRMELIFQSGGKAQSIDGKASGDSKFKLLRAFYYYYSYCFIPPLVLACTLSGI